MKEYWYIPMQALFMLFQSQWLHMSFAHLIYRFLFMCPPSPLALIAFLPLFHGVHRALKNVVWWRQHTEGYVFQSLWLTALCLVVWFVFSCICWRRKLLWGWLNKVPIYENRRLDLGVILYYIWGYSFFR